MYVLNNKQIECFKDLAHLIPNFISDGGDLKLENVEKLKEFRVICDKRDITGYTLKTDTLLELSPIMEFINGIEEDYAKKLQTHVPLRYLDILTQTESMYVLDSRLGMSIGWRRLFEDFVGENYGVIAYGSKHSTYGVIDKGAIYYWKLHAGLILEALVDRKIFKSNEMRTEIREILKSNTALKDALLNQDSMRTLVDDYTTVSRFIHGDLSQLSKDYLKDALVSLLSSCLDYVGNMRWGVP